jgi:ubiquinone/menaquinone biosynthesis C-methylase UbiE
MLVVKAFEAMAKHYDEWFQSSFGLYVFRHELKLLRKLIESPVDGYMIDIGCGTGLFTVLLTENLDKVIGIDVSINMLKRAHSRGLDVILCDASNLPFKDKVFFKALIFTTLEFTNTGKTLREADRILVEKATLLIGVHNVLNLWNVFRKIKAHVKKASVYRIIRYHSPWSIPNFLRGRYRLDLRSSCIFCPPILSNLPLRDYVEDFFRKRHPLNLFGAILLMRFSKLT